MPITERGRSERIRNVHFHVGVISGIVPDLGVPERLAQDPGQVVEVGNLLYQRSDKVSSGIEQRARFILVAIRLVTCWIDAARKVINKFDHTVMFAHPQGVHGGQAWLFVGSEVAR